MNLRNRVYIHTLVSKLFSISIWQKVYVCLCIIDIHIVSYVCMCMYYRHTYTFIYIHVLSYRMTKKKYMYVYVLCIITILLLRHGWFIRVHKEQKTHGVEFHVSIICLRSRIEAHHYLYKYRHGRLCRRWLVYIDKCGLYTVYVGTLI